MAPGESGSNDEPSRSDRYLVTKASPTRRDHHADQARSAGDPSSAHAKPTYSNDRNIWAMSLSPDPRSRRSLIGRE